MFDYLFTRRLKLKKILVENIPLLVTWSNDREVYGKYLSMENLKNDECLHKFENDYFWNNNSKTYLIELKEDNTSIGTIQYWTKSDDPNTAMVSLKLAVMSFRGQGYGTEAQKGIIRELFKKYKFEAVEMLTDINNIPQQKCLMKLDFDNIEIKEYLDNGINRQGYIFRLKKDKYERSGIHIYYYDD